MKDSRKLSYVALLVSFVSVVLQVCTGHLSVPLAGTAVLIGCTSFIVKAIEDLRHGAIPHINIGEHHKLDAHQRRGPELAADDRAVNQRYASYSKLQWRVGG